jgi:hypothetical protein
LTGLPTTALSAGSAVLGHAGQRSLRLIQANRCQPAGATDVGNDRPTQTQSAAAIRVRQQISLGLAPLPKYDKTDDVREG